MRENLWLVAVVGVVVLFVAVLAFPRGGTSGGVGAPPSMPFAGRSQPWIGVPELVPREKWLPSDELYKLLEEVNSAKEVLEERGIPYIMALPVLDPQEDKGYIIIVLDEAKEEYVEEALTIIGEDAPIYFATPEEVYELPIIKPV